MTKYTSVVKYKLFKMEQEVQTDGPGYHTAKLVPLEVYLTEDFNSMEDA